MVLAWEALREALDRRRMPARELADGALVLVGGTLLITPGFVTDLAGLFCVLPFTRPMARTALTRYVARTFLSGAGAPGYRGQGQAPGRPGQAPTGGRQRPGTDEVVRGEVVD